MTSIPSPSPKRAPARSPKQDPEIVNEQARQRLRQLHAEARFNLAVEPWIPVVVDDRVTRLGLVDVLTQAHRIKDLAEPHPLIRAGLRRLLGGLTVDLVRRANLDPDEWLDLVEDQAGFPAEALAGTVVAHRDHWWLWHPRTPFLQDPRLIDALKNPSGERKPIQEIIPNLPSANSSTWFVKPGELATAAPVNPAQAARWLVARWFYGLPGNSSHVNVPGAQKTTNSQAGGTFTESIATVTHAWRISTTSLLVTLFRNVPAASGTFQAEVGGCAWMDDRRPGPSTDPLYLATLTCTATLLAGHDEAGNVTEVVRAPQPQDQDEVKKIRNSAVEADPHRVITERRKTKGVERKTVRLDPAQRIEALRQFYSDGLDAATLRGVVNSADLWMPRLSPTVLVGEQTEMLLARKNGTGSSPGWDELVTFLLPSGYLDPEHSGFNRVRSAVAFAFHPQQGIYKQLEAAARRLLSPARHDDPMVRGTTRSVQERWLTGSAHLLAQALDGEVDPDENWARTLRARACDAFREVFAPYATSTRYAAPFAIALARLANPRSMS